MNYKRKNIFILRKVLSSIIIALVFTLSISNCIAQAQDFNSPKSKPNISRSNFNFDPDRLVFGGNLGASFGNITLVEVAPTIGYLITDNYLVGISGRYIFYEDKRFFPVYRTNVYGGGIFNQYFILENVILHAEYEVLNLDSRITGLRTNISSVFVGGGYRSSLGGSSYFSVILLYNINDSSESPYPNPLLRIGFGIGMY